MPFDPVPAGPVPFPPGSDPVLRRFRVIGRPDTNHRPRFGGGRTYKAPSYAAWIAAIGWAAAGRFSAWDLAGRYAVRIVVHERDRRSRDLDNFAKPVLDALTRIAWDDDRQVDALEVYRSDVRPGAPCVDVEVRLLAPGRPKAASKRPRRTKPRPAKDEA